MEQFLPFVDIIWAVSWRLKEGGSALCPCRVCMATSTTIKEKVCSSLIVCACTCTLYIHVHIHVGL